jgi:hypothetical protein
MTINPFKTQEFRQNKKLNEFDIQDPLYIVDTNGLFHINRDNNKNKSPYDVNISTDATKQSEKVNKMAELAKKTEVKEIGKTPDYKGDGVAVWVNTDKNGKQYLSIVVANSIKVAAWPYEPKEK